MIKLDHHWLRWWLAYCFAVKPLSEPILAYCQSNPCEHISVKFESKYNNFHTWKLIWKLYLWNGNYFVSISVCLFIAWKNCLQYFRMQFIDRIFLAATKQLYDWFSPSVRLSVCLSVRPSVCLSVTPFSPCSHHRINMKFSGVITMVKSDVHAKGQGQRSKVKVTEVNTQLSRFRTLTPVWIHIWQWNHAHSWKQHRRGALLFFKVIRQISRSHGSKIRRIWPRLGFPDCNSSLNTQMATTWCTKLEVA